jgi:hypothetical protein
MSISNYAENELLDAVFNNGSFAVATPYVSLHTGDPGETGANEVAGGSYARQLGSFGAAASGAVSNDADIDFTLMPSATVTHVGVWDASTVGNFLWGGALAASKVVNSGDTFRIATGDLDITLD